MVWHDEHEIFFESVAFLKHGESIRPLYSRPDTRIMPSGQKESRTSPGSRASTSFAIGDW